MYNLSLLFSGVTRCYHRRDPVSHDLPVTVSSFDLLPGLVNLDVLIPVTRDAEDALQSVTDPEQTAQNKNIHTCIIKTCLTRFSSEIRASSSNFIINLLTVFV